LISSGRQVLYTGDFSREEDRHLCAAEIPAVRPDVLITVSEKDASDLLALLATYFYRELFVIIVICVPISLLCVSFLVFLRNRRTGLTCMRNGKCVSTVSLTSSKTLLRAVDAASSQCSPWGVRRSCCSSSVRPVISLQPHTCQPDPFKEV
jgi:hypothetical protein